MFQNDGRCYVHNFELADARCRNCGYEFCAECLVFAFGANKPPYCIACALAAAGVRSNAARQPTMSRREIKRMEKERKKAEREKASSGGPKVDAAMTEAERTDHAGAPATRSAADRGDPGLMNAPAPPRTQPSGQPLGQPGLITNNPFAWADDPNGGQRVPY